MRSRPDSEDPIFSDLAGVGQTLQLLATDVDTAWLVQRSPAGVVWRHGHAPADVTVCAPARELLLVLNRRLEPIQAGIEIIGDRALFRHWLEHSRF